MSLINWASISGRLPRPSKAAKLAWGGIALVGILLAILPLALQPQTETGARLGNDTLTTAALGLNVTFKLGIVVLLIYASLFVLKQMQGGKSSCQKPQQLVVLESIHLSPRQALHLVRVGQQTLLIGATDNSINLVGELDSTNATESIFAEEENATPTSPSLPAKTNISLNFGKLIAGKFARQ